MRENYKAEKQIRHNKSSLEKQSFKNYIPNEDQARAQTNWTTNTRSNTTKEREKKYKHSKPNQNIDPLLINSNDRILKRICQTAKAPYNLFKNHFQDKEYLSHSLLSCLL